jgi:hypothetical protein
MYYVWYALNKLELAIYIAWIKWYKVNLGRKMNKSLYFIGLIEALL